MRFLRGIEIAITLKQLITVTGNDVWSIQITYLTNALVTIVAIYLYNDLIFRKLQEKKLILFFFFFPKNFDNPFKRDFLAWFSCGCLYGCHQSILCIRKLTCN